MAENQKRRLLDKKISQDMLWPVAIGGFVIALLCGGILAFVIKAAINAALPGVM